LDVERWRFRPRSAAAGLFVAHRLEARAAVALRRRGAVGVVLELVHAAAEVDLEVRVHRQVVLHVRARVADRQAGAAAVGGVGLGTVDGAVVVERALAGLQAELHGRVGLEVGAILELEGQHRVRLGRAAVLDDAALVGAGDQLHATVDLVDVVEGEPDSDGVVGRHRPVVGVLVPSDGGHAVRVLDEEVAGPAVEIRPEDALDEIQNLRIHADVVEVGARLVPFADVLGGLIRLEQGEEVGELRVELGHLLLGVDGRQAEQVAVLVVEALLGGGELVGIGGGGGGHGCGGGEGGGG